MSGINYAQVLKLIRKHGIAHEAVYHVLAVAALDWTEEQGVDLTDKLVLDVGCGSGTFSSILTERKAKVIAFDVNFPDLQKARHHANSVLSADAMRLGIADNVVDLILCSKMLEHVVRPYDVITESYRVLKPGGRMCLTWCNWLSPFGGHEFTPFHLISQAFGPNIGLQMYRLIRRRETCVQIAYKTFWPTYIGKTLSFIKKETNFSIVSVVPRYWPSLKFICAIPFVREFLTWNCQMLLEKSHEPATLTN